MPSKLCERHGGGEERSPCTEATVAHSLSLSGDPAREASSYRSVRSTHSTRLVCVCDDPTGPVFWPRLTRALGACSPRSHPSGHALFHPGERIVRRGVGTRRPFPIGETARGVAGRRGRPADDRRALTSTVDVPGGRTEGGRRGVRGCTAAGQDFIGSGAGDSFGAGCTVAPRSAKRRKPACWNARVVTPTRRTGTPSTHGHEDTDCTTPRDGRFTISGIGSIGDFNGLIGKKGVPRCAHDVRG